LDPEAVDRLLQAERKLERKFALEASTEPIPPTGWSAALLMFHVGRWRQRLRDGLRQFRDSGTEPNPPRDIDALNDGELPRGARISLPDAVVQSDSVASELMDLWRQLGDRPFKWYVAETTGQAVIRISYYHPRNHLAEHFIERGDQAGGDKLFEETVMELRHASAAPHTLSQSLYNLAIRKLAVGREDQALLLVNEAISLRPDLRSTALSDPRLAGLVKQR